MRFFNYLMTFLIVALPFFSCVEEDNNEEKNAMLQLTINGTSSGNDTRSAGTPAAENQINRVAVAIFNSDGSINALTEFSGSTTATIQCTAEANCKVVVVANAPAGFFAGSSSRTSFMSKLLTLELTNDGGAQSSLLLPMSGEKTVTLTSGSVVSETVEISRLVARIAINGIKTDFDPAGIYKDATFKLNRIFVLNALSSTVAEVGDATTTMPSTPSFIHGGTDNNTSPWTAGINYLLNEITETPIGTAAAGSFYFTDPYYFYAYANNNVSSPTILSIGGMFDPDGDAGVQPAHQTYYSIVVNKTQLNTVITEGGSVVTDVRTGSIARNTIYQLKAIIKGDGTDDPLIIVDPADLNLTVNVADWALTIDQTVTFE